VRDGTGHHARGSPRLEEVRLDVLERPFRRPKLVEHSLHAARVSALRLRVIERGPGMREDTGAVSEQAPRDREPDTGTAADARHQGDATLERGAHARRPCEGSVSRARFVPVIRPARQG
jgi:hypothetical protein